MKIIFSKKCLEYQSPGHPESWQRLNCIYNLLKEKQFEFVEAKPCKEKDILGIHSVQLLERVKGGDFLDSDTPNLKGIFDYARLSSGAAIQAAEFALNGKNAFSLMRPPGHHTSRNRAAGFCYFNNVAVAVNWSLNSIKKVAIVDIDCHHGNGTQDIFMEDNRVLYVSLHQSPLYPGTGLQSIKNCLNFPLPQGTDEEIYLKVLQEVMEVVKNFAPQVLAISAGFDTYKDDPLTSFNLEKQSYFKIAKLLASLKLPAFSVLEGGYKIPELAECVEQYLKGWG